MRHHARCGMHSYSTNIVAPNLDLTGVKPCAQRQADLLLGGGPKRQGASDRAAGPVKCRQNTVAGAFDQDSTMLFDHLVRKQVVAVE